MNLTKNEVYSLLKEWCDYMLDHTVKGIEDPNLKGAMLCPACGFVHGRFADSILAYTLLYTETGDEKYLKAADEAVDWSENNVLTPEGTWYNDINATWYGTGLFSAMALGETLHNFKGKIPEDIYNKWYKIFVRMAEGCKVFVHYDWYKPVINYYCGAAAFFAFCYRFLGDEKYKAEANYWEEIISHQFDSDGLLFGESHPIDDISKKGCYGIDLGYNLEESLQLLIQYALYIEDEVKLKFYCDKALAHLEFIMPDGAIDNSFGSRHNKWTYWGSRTSDGVQEAFPRVAKYDRRFAKTAALNFDLLRRCTVNGAFYGGLMQHDANQPACIHHSFAHTKALALMYLYMDEKDFENLENVTLPRETAYGIKTFQNGYLKLISVGDIRATISAIDHIVQTDDRSNMGGNLNFLWHKKYGAICAATMHNFFLVEPTNFQNLRNAEKTLCMTPRIVCGDYKSDADKTVEISSSGDNKKSTVSVAGNNELNFKIDYTFEGDEVKIAIASEKDALYSLPIIAESKAEIKASSPNEITFRNMLTVSSNAEIKTEDGLKRYFNQVGGFEYLPLEIPLKANETTEISLIVK
ncbi:MAG: hypothetical protein E7551_03340 [Ruminococcaceae bacterium]|nr:hypothetical protein [Oscillospiraceae bacterium]